MDRPSQAAVDLARTRHLDPGMVNRERQLTGESAGETSENQAAGQ
jgi:hypothetical protein